MISIKSLGSSSKANSFILSDGVTTILLDAGLPVDEMRSKLFELGIAQTDIDGVLITHHHQDHMQGISSVIHCTKYITRGELKASSKYIIGDESKIKFIKAGEIFRVGTFAIKPFATQHDSAESVGFVIKNVSGELVVYMTDTGIANMLVKNADAYIIEVNHSSKEGLIKTAEDPTKKMNMETAIRIANTHLSEEQSLRYLKKCIGDKTKAIILMHISPKHPNPVAMMNSFRKELDTNIVSFVHPVDHKIHTEWKVGYEPERKREF